MGGSREGACGKQSGGLKGRGAGAGMGTFIHPSSFTFSLLVVVCCFEVECSGGARWDTVWLSTVRGGGVCVSEVGGGALHAILVKRGERDTLGTQGLLRWTLPMLRCYRTDRTNTSQRSTPQGALFSFFPFHFKTHDSVQDIRLHKSC